MAVYRFRVKKNISIGGLVCTEGMNVEVVDPTTYRIPFTNITERLFVQEFADKYNIEKDSSKYSSVRHLFNRDYLDVVEI